MSHTADASNPAEFPPAEFWRGIEQFNQGEFYACHDTLEAIWMEAEIQEKSFYQAILQIAVALYHLTNKNWRGAAILLGEGISRLDQYAPNYGGIDVLDLLDRAAAWLAALQQVGPDRVEELAEAIFSVDPSGSLQALDPPLPQAKILKM